MTQSLPKPSRLQIRAEGGRLVGTDADGREWLIRWCGNGAYSHWWLRPRSEPEAGYYVYTRPNHHDEALIRQIEDAEKRHGIYR